MTEDLLLPSEVVGGRLREAPGAEQARQKSMSTLGLVTFRHVYYGNLFIYF